MNKQLYKIIFSKRLGTLVAVGEHATSAGKAASGQGCRGTVVADGFVGALRFTFASVALACLSLGTQAQSTVVALASTALPQGGSVSTGSAAISTNGANMAITQSTDKASINWQSFNIGSAASVNIAQSSSSAVLLNRVVGNDPSQILGKLTANGQVILLNPNGVLFGKDGSVTASAFTASTFGLSDTDFMAGYYKYNRNGSTASVVNNGNIHVTPGGYVALIGAEVTNNGTITAPQGAVVMAAAESVALPAEITAPRSVGVPLSKRVRLELAPAAVNTAINNTENGVIVTEGGQVLMQAGALATAVASVTHSGNIDTSGPQAGDVTLLADGGRVKVDGRITANSTGQDSQGQANMGGRIVIGRDEDTGVLATSADVSGASLESKGGFVETSGHQLTIDNTRVVAKDWLLDPDNIQITNDASLATGYTSRVSATDLGTSLSAGTSVTINTTSGNADTGNIYINTAVSKTGASDATLTLVADNGIIMNSAIGVASGAANTGKLHLDFTAKGIPGGGSAPTSANADSLGIVIGGVGNMSLNGGDLTLTGTSYKNNGAGVTFIPAALSSAGGATAGPTLNITAGNITVNGTANTFSGTSGNGIYMTRYPNPVQLTATGNVNMIGTVNGAGTGSGFYSAFSGVTNAANSITAGGTLTLRGNNRASSSSTSAAVYADGGLQLRSAGNLIVQAETNNAGANAISFSSGAGSTVNANASFQSVDSNGNASGNVLIQSNTGGINFANNLAEATSSKVIKGVNITIDNTGAGMATGAGSNVGSGGTTGGTVGAGSIDNATGAITKGTGQAQNNTGVNLNDNRTIIASGNINIYGVTSLYNNTYGVGISSSLTSGGTMNIIGQHLTVGYAGGGGVIVRNGASFTTQAGANNLVKGIMPSYGASNAMVLGDGGTSTVTINAQNGSTLQFEGNATTSTTISSGQIVGGIRAQGTLNSTGNVKLRGTTLSSHGVVVDAAINHSGGTLDIYGSASPGRVDNGWGISGVYLNKAITVSDGSNLNIEGRFISTTTNQNGSTGYGVLSSGTGTLTGVGGQLNITGASSLITGGTTSTVGVYTNAGISGWGETTVLGQNAAGSTAVATQIMGNINVGNNTLKVLANGGPVYQGSSSTLSAGRIIIDNTGAGRTSLFADTSGSPNANITNGQSFGGGIAADGAITAGTAAKTNGSATRGLDLNGAMTASTGSIHLGSNSSAYINSALTSTAGDINSQSKGSVTIAKALSAPTSIGASGGNISVSTTSGDIIQSANITAGKTATIDNSTATGRSILRTAGTLTANNVVLKSYNQIGESVAATGQAPYNTPITVVANSVSMQSAGHQYLSGGSSMSVAAQSTSGDINIATTVGNLTVDTVNSINSISTTGTVTLNAAAAITASNDITAGNLYMTAGTTIGTSTDRIQTNASNIYASSAGDQFITGTASGTTSVAARTTANNGSIDIATTDGTLWVTTVNSLSGITAHGSGDITLEGNQTGASGYGLSIASNVTSTSGDITLTGTTAANSRPGDAWAGVRNGATVSGANITLTATATDTIADVLGYYGGAGSLIASDTLTATGTSGGAGVGFYMWGGTTQAANGVSISGTSNTGPGVSLTNSAQVKNTTAGDMDISGFTNNTTSSYGVFLTGASIVNQQGGVTLESGKGSVQAASGTNTITTNGALAIRTLTAGDDINGTSLTLTQNGNADTTLLTKGSGDITAPTIVNNGTGDVVVAAGSDVAAGTGAGGQVLTVSGHGISNTNGDTYIYTGTASDSGQLSYLTNDFASLYYQGSSHTRNAQFNTAYNGTIAGGASSQVLFRDPTANAPTFTLTLNDISKTYGDADPANQAALNAALLAAYTGASSLSSTVSAANSGTNTFAVTAADVISNLSGTSRTAGSNVGSYAYTNLSGSSYNTSLSAQPSLSITPRDITLTAVTASNKTYDGNTTASISGGTFGNIVAGESLGLSGSGTFDSANVDDVSTVTVANVAALTKTNGTGSWSNYNLTSTGSLTSSAVGNITPATLTATVNGSAIFVTQAASTAPDMGVSYSGFVGNDTAATALSGSAVRSYTGLANYPAAGTHAGVFGLSSTPTASHGNYNISLSAGDLTVVPADKLLITIASQSASFGSQTSANAGTAAVGTVSTVYCLDPANCSGANLYSLTTTRLSSNQWKAADNTGSYVVFDTSVASPLYTSGNLSVGNYTYTATEINPLSLYTNGVANFNGRFTNGGVLTITASGGGGGGGGGGSNNAIVKPPLPIIPSDGGSGGGGGSSGGDASAGNPYVVLPNNGQTTERCNANNLEACLCEEQPEAHIQNLAICYQPKKTAETKSTKNKI
jgi:filamentous hemagglutinin family protein